MSKKAVSLLLVLGLAGILAACGGGDTTAPADSPAASPEAPAASPPP